MTSTPGFPALTVSNCALLSQRGGVRLERGCWQGRDVFVKTLDTADPDIRQRFEHEGEVARRLSHPGIVPLLTRSSERLVFPWVAGCSLRERLEHGPLSPYAALEVTLGVLAAMQAFHEAGVVHHDLKPENVMLLGGRSCAGCVRVTDFGMAHDRTLSSDLHQGTRMGTPQFMPPEQFQGVRGDPRSDVYAVGALLFDCLAGEPPHPDALGWLVGLSSVRLPLPGPAALHPLLESALERDPQRRPPSARALLRALEEVRRRLPPEPPAIPGTVPA
ncbi:serine/threonine protein kinase [Deinococcus irradiatisoli]|uniref:Serine/threonine protein kinase n=1 Tax=Deinococcus irradiatisoli TaxID=2202254 RepID=A0A2Z3JIW4_9DEIO|nr:serine/threonine-protein kinase [Deinococcus irradiatisoli]AWN22879.1 serine/threonine protein kinase [Deinococcus irradiatisoli]